MEDRQALFLERLRAYKPTPYDILPDLGLYMDQVITYIQRQCRGLYPEGDRILTPAMVNNYVKFGLVGRPVDKKYGQDQLAQLLMLCTLKSAATMDEMKRLMTLPQGASIREHYECFCRTQCEVCAKMQQALPLPDTMTCVVQAACYRFLCTELLAPDPQDAEKEREKEKGAHGESRKEAAVAQGKE